MKSLEKLASEQLINGTFLAGIEIRAAQASPLSGAVNTITEKYIAEGELGFALSHIQDQGRPVQLIDNWHNGALDALAHSSEASGFNDTTSGGGNRVRSEYLAPVFLHHKGTVENPLNTDERFPGLRPRGFEIDEADQPVMAIVALDPSRLDPAIDATTKAAYIAEVKELRLAATSDDEATRTAAAGRMSPGLREVLNSCLLANDTFISNQGEDGSTQEWERPFDLIASLKALYTLLSAEDSSATMRQGAVRASNPNGQEIIVGCSGLNSAIDEMVARNFASDVLAEARRNLVPATPASINALLGW